MNTKHSPAPWKAHTKSKKITAIIADNGYHIASVYTLVQSEKQDEANINLLLAAPELLALLEDFEYHILIEPADYGKGKALVERAIELRYKIDGGE